LALGVDTWGPATKKAKIYPTKDGTHKKTKFKTFQFLSKLEDLLHL